jgi:hypothetical protein
MRSEDMFKLFWVQVTGEAEKIGIDEPTVPRKRRAPLRLDAHNTTGVIASQPEDHYRVLYFEALDTETCSISARFEQEGYKVYAKLEELLLKGVDVGEESYCDDLFKLYRDDFKSNSLLVQLRTFHVNYKIEDGMSIHDVFKMVQGISEAQRSFFSEIVKLTRLLLVIPATNAISERSFSAMRRIKAYLRSTMLQERLNSVMVMHIHKDLTESVDLPNICKEFRDRSDYRKNRLPKF